MIAAQPNRRVSRSSFAARFSAFGWLPMKTSIARLPQRRPAHQ